MRPELKILEFQRKPEERHIPLLEKLEKSFWDGGNLLKRLRAIQTGDLWLWEVRGERALVLTEINEHEGLHELYIYGIVGSGMIRHAAEIRDDLRTIAREYGCSVIGGNVMHRGLERLYQSWGSERRSAYYTLEVR